MCQALEVNHPSQDSCGTKSRGILQNPAIPFGQFDNDNQFEPLYDIDYGLPFDNDIGNISFDISPSSTDTSLDCFVDSSFKCSAEENDFFDLIDLDFTNSSNIKHSQQPKTAKASSTLERGISIFEEHLEYLKSKDTCEDSISKEKDLDEVILPDELNNDDLQFILKERHKRNQNNESSKRSREARKRKFAQMNDEADMLEVENCDLKRKISKIELLIDKYNSKINEALQKNPNCR